MRHLTGVRYRIRGGDLLAARTGSTGRVSLATATHSSGTAIPSINTKTLGSLPVALPSLTIQRAIGRTLDALNQKIAAHELICQATAELRDTLLPLLLSGRVRP